MFEEGKEKEVLQKILQEIKIAKENSEKFLEFDISELGFEIDDFWTIEIYHEGSSIIIDELKKKGFEIEIISWVTIGETIDSLYIRKTQRHKVVLRISW